MNKLPSSFRDPGGFVFFHDGLIYRQINLSFALQFDDFIDSGLYAALVKKGYLIPHVNVDNLAIPRDENCHLVIKPTPIPYISYSYEWSFSQLKDAAMLTLRIQALALQYGFSLKDASAFNVQFYQGRPIFIDTLSFVRYLEGEPWIAYRQFCQHFLAPLALMAKVDIELGILLTNYIDGIPLKLAARLLPTVTKLNYGLLMHIHMHARLQSNFSDAGSKPGMLQKAKNTKVSATGILAIINGLASLIDKLQCIPGNTEWGSYYGNTNYHQTSAESKRKIVEELLATIPVPLLIVQDLGANNGEFSRIAAKYADTVISQDIDPVAVEKNYLQCKASGPKNILPLVQNLLSPTPSIGWANQERSSFCVRAKADAILALALVHHLAISNNTPLEDIAKLFAELSAWLIIEFIPKSDTQVIRLLETREDIFLDYNEKGFEQAFMLYFLIEKKETIVGCDRSLYLMKSLLKN